MKKNKKALSITEAMVVLLIVTLGLVGVYSILSRSFKVTTNLGNKITAIQIAREGIEAVQNIRDTNWLLFPLDKENCWITENYNAACFGDITNSYSYKIQDETSYKVYKNENGRWYLESPSSENGITGGYLDEAYRNFYAVNVDDDGLYTQSGGTAFLPTFTRQIITEYANGIPDDPNTLTGGLNVKSIVRWLDNSSTFPNEVTLEMTLTNYKK